MTKFKITKEIFDYISEHSANFSEVTPSPTLGEEWIVKDIKTYPNVNNGNSVVEAEREDGCYIRLPENIVKIYTIDKEQTGKFGLQEEPVSSVWHDSNKEQPKCGSNVVIWSPTLETGELITKCAKVFENRIWTYLDDLLKM